MILTNLSPPQDQLRYAIQYVSAQGSKQQKRARFFTPPYPCPYNVIPSRVESISLTLNVCWPVTCSGQQNVAVVLECQLWVQRPSLGSLPQLQEQEGLACWRMRGHTEESPTVPGKAILHQPVASKPRERDWPRWAGPTYVEVSLAVTRRTAQVTHRLMSKDNMNFKVICYIAIAN